MSGAATAIGIGAAVGGIGSIAGGAIGAGAAKDAASTQASAADRAAQLQYQASQDALNFQKQQYSDTQRNLAPWLQSGSNALSSLNNLLGQPAYQLPTVEPPPPTGMGGSIPGGAGGSTPPPPPPPGMPVTSKQGQPAMTPDTSFGSLMQSYPGGQFKPPSASDLLTSDPGYQARLNLGTDALQRSAAARGNLLTGGTAQALNAFAQDYASNEYGNAYNRSLNNYATNYNTWNQDQTNKFNRLAALAGIGQQTAGQLAGAGQNTASSVSSNLLGTANSMGNAYQNAAAANASGIVGGANAWSGALNNGTSSISQLLLLRGLLGGNTGAGGTGLSNGYAGLGSYQNGMFIG